MVQLIEIIQEYMKMSKNISIYRKFGRNYQMEDLIFDQRFKLNA